MRKKFAIADKKKLHTICLNLAIFLAIALAVVCWQGGQVLLNNSQSYYGGLLQLRMQQEPLNAGDIKQLIESRKLLEEDSQTLLTVWTQKTGIEIKNLSLGRAEESRVLYYYGDNNALFNLQLDNGCGVSDQLAFKLYGTKDILGQTVQIGGQKYVVEKVLAANKVYGSTPIVIAKADDKDEDMVFDVVDVRGFEKNAPDDIVMSGISSQRLNADLEMDYDNLTDFFRAMQATPIYLLALGLAGRFVYLAFKSRGQNLQKSIGLGLAAIGVMGLCVVVFGLPFYLPESLIPTRWSNFAFWQERFTLLGGQLQYLSNMEYYGPDRGIVKLFHQLCLSGLATAALLLSALGLGKIRLKSIDK